MFETKGVLSIVAASITEDLYRSIQAEGTASVSPMGFLHKDTVGVEGNRPLYNAFFHFPDGTYLYQGRMTDKRFQDLSAAYYKSPVNESPMTAAGVEKQAKKTAVQNRRKRRA